MPDPVVTPTPEPTPAPAPAAPWYGTLDDTTKGWFEGKGLHSMPAPEGIATLIKSYNGAEKLLGTPAAQLVKLPSDLNAAGALDEVYLKLGRPAAADKYDLPMKKAEGTNPPADKEFADWAKPVFHEAGLTQAQATKMYAKFTGLIEESMAKDANEAQLAMQADVQSLKTEWGSKFDERVAMANAAVDRLEAPDDVVLKLKEVLGLAPMMRLFANIGAKVVEPGFVGSQQPGGEITPLAAWAQIEELKADKAFGAKLLAGDVEANNKFRRLTMIASAVDRPRPNY